MKHDDTSSCTAMSFKKGDFNSPSAIDCLKENDGFDYSKAKADNHENKLSALHLNVLLSLRLSVWLCDKSSILFKYSIITNFNPCFVMAYRV